MSLPDSLKHLRQLKIQDLDTPDEAWLTYSVCACEDDSCGWQGWIVESASSQGRQLPADNSQRCPVCGKTLFRTAASVRCVPSRDQQPPLVEGRDYELVKGDDPG